ncbi:caspase family protein [Candidatus Halobeggiatoa sp. HSG11]|nr:caspase family protein [Candidatus Halobeggiatoa sp. HSG11]
MKILLIMLLLFLQFFSFCTFAFSCVETENCYALVINNSHYPDLEEGGYLQNTERDGPGMKKILRNKGFYVKNVQDVSLKRFEQEVDNFVDKVPSDTPIALVYFSGHGLTSNKERYYIPSNFKRSNETNNNLFSLKNLVEKLTPIKAKSTILIVDACSNKPVESSDGKKTSVKSASGIFFRKGTAKDGLIIPEYPPNFVSLFATRPTDVALDSFPTVVHDDKELDDGTVLHDDTDVQHCVSKEMKVQYSVYTSQLINFINQERLPFGQLVSDVSKKVIEMTEEYLACVKKELIKHGKETSLEPPQSAWVEGNLGNLSNFYFSPPEPNQRNGF